MLIEMLKETFNPLDMFRFHGFFGLFMCIVFWLISGLILAIITSLAMPLWKPLVFKIKLSEPINVKVMVSSKRHFTTTSSHMMMVGKVMVPQTTTISHYEVTLSNEEGFSKVVDNQELYNKVTEGESGTLRYQNEYWKRRGIRNDFSLHEAVNHQFNGQAF